MLLSNSESISNNKRLSLLLDKVAGLDVNDPDWPVTLEQWIKQHPAKWWSGVWLASEIKGDTGQIFSPEQPSDFTLKESFADAKLNIAENLLASGAGTDRMLTCWAEDGPIELIGRVKLKEIAGRFASAFADLGLQAGDKVVIDLPNVPDKLGAFLGASWLGLTSVLHFPWDNLDMQVADSWEDMRPKLILSCDGYRRNGKWIDCARKITRLAEKFHNSAMIVPVPCARSRDDVQNIAGVLGWEKFQRIGMGGGRTYQHINFNQELVCFYEEKNQTWESISTGEWLLHNLSFWRLQTDIGLNCHSLYIGPQSHENWLKGVCALATGTDIVLYDGAADAMNEQLYWRIIEREKVRIVRIDESWLMKLFESKANPHQNHQLESVQVVIVDGKTTDDHIRFLREKCFVNVEQIILADDCT
ncbi:MAG: hypothetical protein JKY46_10045 [Robiginitomaculum sp.]|nr:hypothetical protein [Robiginitomaculum sp.]